MLEEQRAALAESADDLRIRAVVAETRSAEKEFREAQRHVDAMDNSRKACTPPSRPSCSSCRRCSAR